MKIALLIISIILTITIPSQTITDEVSDEEMANIILNYRDKGIENFKIITQVTFNKEKYKKNIFYYSFENDSVLIHTYDDEQVKFIIQDKEFNYFQTQEEIASSKSISNPFFSKIRDSLNFHYFDRFRIVNQDTVLLFSSIDISDSLKRNIVSLLYFGSDTLKQSRRTETTYLEGDTIQSLHYVDLGMGEGLTLHSKSKEYFTKEIKDNYEEYKKFHNVISYPMNEYSLTNFVHTKRIYYNKKGLIEKVVIFVDELTSEIQEKTVFTPVVLK